jgi:DNA-binding SARP family transcriptional activator/tetratricopeptide (TPR) repeat protein
VARRREVADQLEIQLLGELTVLSKGLVRALPASRKARSLLAYLVATGVAERRERLCDLLWDGTSDPRAELRWCLSRLKAVLEEDGQKRLTADRERVAFEPNGAIVDLAALEALIGPSAPELSLESAIRAATLFRGDFVAGLDLPDCRSFHSWVVSRRETYRARHLAILAGLVERLRHRPLEALPYARAFVAIDSESETGHLLVMEVLGALGRKREALEHYKAFRAVLEREHGARPSARMEQARMALGTKGAGDAGAGLAAGAPMLSVSLAVEPSRPPLVGRRAEVAAIAEVRDRALSGAGPHALVLTGEPGIGKSRLLEELATQVKAAAGLSLGGRAFEAEMTRPYGAWVDALRGHAPAPSMLGRFPDLAMLLPELGPHAGAATAGPTSQPTSDRNRLFEALLGFFSHLTEQAPLAILLDDVHWLDEGSAALLHYLVRRMRGRRILIACATRPGELTANASVARVLRTLGAEHGARVLPIGPLDAGATADLVRAVDPGVDPDKVFVESHGNSLFALEVARALAERGTRLSDSLEGIIADRLAGLDDAAKSLVAWAACLGGRIRLDVLASGSGSTAADVLRSIEDLERRAILRVTGDESYGFAHDLIQHVAYQQIAEPRRRFMHAEIANALSKGRNPDASLAIEIAHHADLGAVHRLAARTAAAAGQHCLAVFANAEALAVARRGLTHAVHLDPDERVGVRVSLLAVMAQAMLVDWRSRYPELEKEIECAAEEAHQAGNYDAAAYGRYMLSMLHERDDARAHYESLLAGEDARSAAPTAAVRQLANAGQCLAHIQRDMSCARTFLHDAERMADDLGVEISSSEVGLGMLAMWDGELERACEHLERGLRLVRQERDRYLECLCLGYLTRLELQRNRPDQALAHCKELIPIASGMGEGSEAPIAAALEALAHLSLGTPEADGKLLEALDTLAQIDAQAALAYALNGAALFDLRRGRFEAARQHAERALIAAERVGRSTEVALARVLLAEVAFGEGQRRAAKAHLEPLLSHPLDPNALDARTRDAARSLATRLEIDIPTT